MSEPTVISAEMLGASIHVGDAVFYGVPNLICKKCFALMSMTVERESRSITVKPHDCEPIAKKPDTV